MNTESKSLIFVVFSIFLNHTMSADTFEDIVTTEKHGYHINKKYMIP